jgi:REP element-mobilizing transposase RayT
LLGCSRVDRISESAKRTTEETTHLKKEHLSHSYVSNLMHCTFSTKQRFPFIEAELELRLWPYIGGIAREHRIKPLAIGGIADHVHALLSLPATMSFAKAVQLIKGGSSKWVHAAFPKYQQFARAAEGYGAFSVSRYLFANE